MTAKCKGDYNYLLSNQVLGLYEYMIYRIVRDTDGSWLKMQIIKCKGVLRSLLSECTKFEFVYNKRETN